MEDFKKIIKEFKRTFSEVYKTAEGLDKYMLFEAYSSIKNFLELDFRTSEDLKNIFIESERKVYTTKQKALTDKEIIAFEYDKIIREYETKKNLIDQNDDMNIEKQKLKLVEYYLSKIRIFKGLETKVQNEHLGALKSLIAQIAILLGIKNGLYYETFLFLAGQLGYSDDLEQSEKKPKISGR
jgi:hypothetical protein